MANTSEISAAAKSTLLEIAGRVPIIAFCVALLILVPKPGRAQTQITFQYVYDDLGQLVKVVDSAGNEIDYQYDAAGNIISITRGTAPPPGTLAIFTFTPQQGVAGNSVTIYGQAFNPSSTGDSVQFNGTPARINSATATTLVVTVPASVTTGPISVAVAGQTVTSSQNFIVATGSVAGTVFRFGGSTTVPGATVTVNSGVATTTTNAQGAFSFPQIPAGPIILDATDPSTGDRGRASTLLASNGQSVTQNIVMNGVGQVQVTTVHQSGAAVGNVQVTITSVTQFGGSQSGITSASGTVTFPQVLAGPFSVTATLPAANESGFAPGTVAVNSSANVTVVLQSSVREADSLPFSVLNMSSPVTGVLSREADSLLVSVLNGSAPFGPPMVVEADSLMFSVLNTAPVARNVPHGNTVLGAGNESASNGDRKRRTGMMRALFAEHLWSGISRGFKFLSDLHLVSARRESSSALAQGGQK